MNRQKSKPETFVPKIESPETKIGYIWSSTSHQYKHNALNIQISSPPFDVRFVHPVLNYRIVRIVNSSISTQPATLQQLIVMTKSRKYDEFKVWKAYQHHRSDPDTIRNHLIVMSNSKETQSVSAPPEWPRHYQKPLDCHVKFKGNPKRISTTGVTQTLSETNEILCLTLQQYMHIAFGNTRR